MLGILLAASLAKVDEPAWDALAYFEGAWSCKGQFVPSQKPIASRITFEADPETKSVIKHHADEPPGEYRATETWASSNQIAGYRAAIVDAFSGLRWYTSPGWIGDVWTWARYTADGEPHEAFVYTRRTHDTMQVDWRISRRGGPLTLGDTLSCKRT